MELSYATKNWHWHEVSLWYKVAQVINCLQKSSLLCLHIDRWVKNNQFGTISKKDLYGWMCSKFWFLVMGCPPAWWVNWTFGPQALKKLWKYGLGVYLYIYEPDVPTVHWTSLLLVTTLLVWHLMNIQYLKKKQNNKALNYIQLNLSSHSYRNLSLSITPIYLPQNPQKGLNLNRLEKESPYNAIVVCSVPIICKMGFPDQTLWAGLQGTMSQLFEKWMWRLLKTWCDVEGKLSLTQCFT